MEFGLLIIRLVLFGIFAVAGVGKLLDREGSKKAVLAFGTPEPFVTAFAVLIPIAELIFASCLLFTSYSWLGAAGALLLMITFIFGMLVQVIKGEAPDCHCFGQIHSEPVGPKSLVRNILIAILPVILLANGRGFQGYPLGETNVQIASNALVSMLVALAIVGGAYLVRLSNEYSALKRRVELLEMLDIGAVPLERNEAGDPMDSLPIGAPFPDFTLPDINGKIVTFEHILSRPHPKLIVFVGPACKPCKAMLEEFLAWKREFAERLQLVFISKGIASENLERFGDELSERMLFQNNMEFAAELHIKWTPAAILVSAEGNLASHPAIGDLAIRDLVGKLRSEEISKPGYYIKNGQRRGRVKIGESVPEFSAVDINGNRISRETFLGKPTLTFFLSTTCSFCAEVVDQIRRWEQSSERNGTNAIIFSEGDEELHRNYGLQTPIVIDHGYKLSANLGIFGAPSGVIIDQRGVIASETAIGGPMIWSLIGRKPE